MLTAQEIRQYRANGYVVPDFRLPAEAVEEISDAHGRLLAKHPQFADYCPAVLAFDAGFLNIARMPAILDQVEQLIGPDFALWNSSFFAKPPRVGTKTPWHQDGEYWPIRPLATCSVWIAVDAATTESRTSAARSAGRGRQARKTVLLAAALHQLIDKYIYFLVARSPSNVQ